MTKKRYSRIRQVLSARQPDLTVVMEDVHKPHNLAAIARSADATGLMKIHATGKNEKIILSQRAASGATKWIDLVQHPALPPLVDSLRNRGHQCLAMTIDKDARDYRDVDYTLPTALMVGAELDGLTPAAVNAADALVYIPMLGMVDSLNVSVATALVLFEARRQREAAGLYDTPRIPPDEFDALVFEWCQPGIAEYCRRHGVPYPALDEEGDVIGGLPAVDGALHSKVVTD